VQRRLLERLAFQKGRKESANLFIVAIASIIYGFRGADVDVFRERTKALAAVGGVEKPLRLEFSAVSHR